MFHKLFRVSYAVHFANSCILLISVRIITDTNTGP